MSAPRSISGWAPASGGRCGIFFGCGTGTGDETAHHLSADDVELLEDWAAAEGRPAPAADIKRPGSHADRRQACRPERAKRAKRTKKQVSTVNNNA